MLTVGSLFSGIGGFDLGLERAGMRVVWQCEQDEFCRRVLAKHWPGVPCHTDVRALVADPGRVEQPQVAQGADGEQGQRPQERRGQLVATGAGAGGRAGDGNHAEGDGGPGSGRAPARDAQVPVPVPYVDVLCGGFPCQDISSAGKGAGIEGARSGLWSEYARLIGELRPRYVLVENVAALLRNEWLGRVLGDLAACGYDAEWDCLSASAFGAPHRRDRVWLVAYPNGDGEPHGPVDAEAPRYAPAPGRGAVGNSDSASAHALAAAGTSRPPVGERGWWASEPDVGRVAHGVPARVDRLRSLGNALVPQIAEWLGRRILEAEQDMRQAA